MILSAAEFSAQCKEIRLSEDLLRAAVLLAKKCGLLPDKRLRARFEEVSKAIVNIKAWRDMECGSA